MQRQLIKEQTNELIIQQKLDKVYIIDSERFLKQRIKSLFIFNLYIKELAKKLQAKEILYENSLVDYSQTDLANKLASSLSLKNHEPAVIHEDDENEDDEDLKLAKRLQKEEVNLDPFRPSKYIQFN